MFERMQKQGLKQEFEENLLSVMNSLYNLGYRMTGNKEEASDLVQEASLRAYRFYHKFEKGTNFKAWIMTILRNTFINQYRKQSKEPYKVDYDTVENYVSVPETTGLAEEIFSENLQASINKLSEELRTVVTLYYVDDLSYKEIAKVMDCPIGTVMSRLYMARQLLKKTLGDLRTKEV